MPISAKSLVRVDKEIQNKADSVFNVFTQNITKEQNGTALTNIRNFFIALHANSSNQETIEFSEAQAKDMVGILFNFYKNNYLSLDTNTDLKDLLTTLQQQEIHINQDTLEKAVKTNISKSNQYTSTAKEFKEIITNAEQSNAASSTTTFTIGAPIVKLNANENKTGDQANNAPLLSSTSGGSSASTLHESSTNSEDTARPNQVILEEKKADETKIATDTNLNPTTHTTSIPANMPSRHPSPEPPSGKEDNFGDEEPSTTPEPKSEVAQATSTASSINTTAASSVSVSTANHSDGSSSESKNEENGQSLPAAAATATSSGAPASSTTTSSPLPSDTPTSSASVSTANRSDGPSSESKNEVNDPSLPAAATATAATATSSGAPTSSTTSSPFPNTTPASSVSTSPLPSPEHKEEEEKKREAAANLDRVVSQIKQKVEELKLNETRNQLTAILNQLSTAYNNTNLHRTSEADNRFQQAKQKAYEAITKIDEIIAMNIASDDSSSLKQRLAKPDEVSNLYTRFSTLSNTINAAKNALDSVDALRVAAPTPNNLKPIPPLSSKFSKDKNAITRTLISMQALSDSYSSLYYLTLTSQANIESREQLKAIKSEIMSHIDKIRLASESKSIEEKRAQSDAETWFKEMHENFTTLKTTIDNVTNNNHERAQRQRFCIKSEDTSDPNRVDEWIKNTFAISPNNTLPSVPPLRLANANTPGLHTPEFEKIDNSTPYSSHKYRLHSDPESNMGFLEHEFKHRNKDAYVMEVPELPPEFAHKKLLTDFLIENGVPIDKQEMKDFIKNLPSMLTPDNSDLKKLFSQLDRNTSELMEYIDAKSSVTVGRIPFRTALPHPKFFQLASEMLNTLLSDSNKKHYPLTCTAASKPLGIAIQCLVQKWGMTDIVKFDPLKSENVSKQLKVLDASEVRYNGDKKATRELFGIENKSTPATLAKAAQASMEEFKKFRPGGGRGG